MLYLWRKHKNRTIMRNFTRSIALAVVAIVALSASMPAAAQFKFGLKAGVAINSLKFTSTEELKTSFGKDNRAGFVGGAMIEFTVPVIGVGLDASLLYVHREAKGDNTTENLKRDYIDIPINLKYKLNIPVISSVVRPFVTTGPSFAFLASKKEINQALENKSTDIAWNFGFGLELLKHVQVAASYGLGLTNTLKAVGATSASEKIEGKNKYWTVTAAYLF